MSVNGSNGIQVGHQDNIGNLNDVSMSPISWEVFEPSVYPSRGKCSVPHKSTMLQLLQLKGLFSGLAHEDPHEHLLNFVDMCGPFSFKNISQELVRLRLFPFSLMGEACKWLAELPRESITSWEELVTAFQVQFFPPSKMMSLRDSIQSFKRLEGEPLHETWRRFKKLVLHAQPTVCRTTCYFNTLPKFGFGKQRCR